MDFIKLRFFLILTVLYTQITQSRNMETTSTKRSLCPSQSDLNCLNALFLYPCETDGDCSHRTGMVCCPTNCPNYVKSMCVSRVTDYCPFQTPYHINQSKCQSQKDCGKDTICCKDVLGKGYCHRT